MLTAKQLSISIAVGLSVWLGISHGKACWSLLTAHLLPAPAAPAQAADTAAAIQVALLLDTSGSMQGLIEQAKSQLWKILNELNRMRKNGETPSLEIALYEYGNPSRASGKLEIHQLSGFTTDMDLISEKLFSLSTNGGDEYCGAVIQASLEELEWKQQDGLRIIYVAGNEPFTQGPVNFQTACKRAVEKGIIVNTIHCGDCNVGIKESWQAGAKAGGGEYLCINHNAETVYVQTPYDDPINQLNLRLNDTYVSFNSEGEKKKSNQALQDRNAEKFNKSNATERAAFKSSKNYKAEDWDLVDAYKKDKKVLQETKTLPDSLQNLSVEAMEAKIQAIITQRENIQQQIQELDQKRRLFIAEQTAQASGGELENSILQSLRKQAEAKGFAVEKPE